MLDTQARALYRPGFDRVAEQAAKLGVTAPAVTAAGLAVGVAACFAVALEQWLLALALWLVNRALDGLDGALARRAGPTDLGGMLDFLADFVVYAGFVVAVAIAIPDTRVACTVLLAAYLLNNVALLSFASLIEKRRLALGDERSLRFTTGLAEGSETVVAYTAICLLPAHAGTIAWIFSAMVLFTVGQRVALAVRTLGGSQPAV
jgi:phosphatidylglycerophosphate synthase